MANWIRLRRSPLDVKIFNDFSLKKLKGIFTRKNGRFLWRMINFGNEWVDQRVLIMPCLRVLNKERKVRRTLSVLSNPSLARRFQNSKIKTKISKIIREVSEWLFWTAKEKIEIFVPKKSQSKKPTEIDMTKNYQKY